MKTASIPSLRVDPELRRAAQSVLREGESLSRFVEESIRAAVRFGKSAEFSRAAARDEAKRTGEYYQPEEIRATSRCPKSRIDTPRPSWRSVTSGKTITTERSGGSLLSIATQTAPGVSPQRAV